MKRVCFVLLIISITLMDNIFTECDEYSKYVPIELKTPPGAHGIIKGVTTKPSEFPHMVCS